MAQKKPVTAANPIARLNADPEFVARRDRADAELEAKEAEWRLAEAPLIEELTAAGFHVESAWDFVNTADSYEEEV